MDSDYEEPVNHRGKIAIGGVVLTAALAGAVAAGAIGVIREHRYTQALEAENAQTSEALSQVQTQMQAMSQQLQALKSQPAPAAPSPETPASPRHAVHRRASIDPRIQRLQSQVADQQRQLADTRQQIASTSTATQDLQGRLQSTRDELSGSIASNHDELVALEKRGERNYYEFTIDKSKDFQRVGPLSLSLRKANTKHAYYDVVMTVGDQRLEKKHVNLFEPVWITSPDQSQPVQLVVNQITKNEIKGYVSEPKYGSGPSSRTVASSTGGQPAPSTPVLKTRQSAANVSTPPGN